MNAAELSRIQRILNILKSSLSIARYHKKKTILLVVIISMYSLWKMKHRIPYQKIMTKVMGKIMMAMDRQMKHQQFVEQCNVKLTLSIKEFEKSLHFQTLQTKYSNLFKIENNRNEIRTKAKQLSKEQKTELWQKIVDETILFVFFFLVTTRQTVTLNLIQKTLLAKYNDDFIQIIGISKDNSANFHILEQILNEYCQTHIDHSINDTLKFIKNNLKHDIQPTTDINFFDLSHKLMDIFQKTLFNQMVQQQQIKKSSSHLTSSLDRPVEKIFFAPHDPTYEKPSIFTRTFNFGKSIGKYILPNLFPEEEILLPTKNRYEVLNILFNSKQQESVAEMNSNKIISNVFKQLMKGSQEQENQEGDLSYHFDDNEEIIESESSNIQNRQSAEHQNQKVIDLRQLKNSNLSVNQFSYKDEITNDKISQGKAFCSLIIKELRDILDMTSLHSFFYYSCIFEMRKFLNRLLLVLQKKNELNKVQSFALISKFFDKLIVEEFLTSEAEQNNEGFYQIRLKKCITLTKNIKNNNQNQLNNDEIQSTDAISNPNKSEQELASSGENFLLQNSSDKSQTDPMEYLINLNILQEIEQFYIVEDSLQELIKRIFFEREKQTVQIESSKINNNNNSQSDSNNGGDITGFLPLLQGLGDNNSGDLMSLLSKM